ncbi:aminoglycoside phosphotransferase [Arthrobacter echini]|uniref:Aminoglycoside phosphotransferase n=1 Tax=Arthrobacter echini TaxID=1529066 RepID=A0A4S5E3J6_9MICC|nr:phosphotransferase [Arthrobacter echini]THJ66006.1 aminoglycoside phosphotransferase [Arthrobacter echini]
MKRTPMQLAAMATAAVPGLAPTGVAGTPDDVADFDSALLMDDSGKQWRVRAPRHVEASMRLETELQALRAFTPAVKAELPFLIPHLAGSVRQGELSTFVYSHLLGSTRTLEAVTGGGPAVAQELGRVIAAIHDLPKGLVQRADLPSYEADEYRQRRLNELDQAATTGRIPAILLRRWEHALEDVGLWRFSPTVVHGDLHEDHLLFSGAEVSAVIGWTELSLSDPAQDFAWLAAAEDADFVQTVHDAYAAARTGAVDPHLLRRSALAAEFALAQWLVRGVALEDASMIGEAQEMLGALAADVASLEREQHEAAERARNAEQERLEWGDERGADDHTPAAHPGDQELHGATAVTSRNPPAVAEDAHRDVSGADGDTQDQGARGGRTAAGSSPAPQGPVADRPASRPRGRVDDSAVGEPEARARDELETTTLPVVSFGH